MTKQIVLTYLPPANILTPSSSLSILKSFMQENGFPTEIKYWNFSLNLMEEHTQNNNSENSLIPFYAILNDKSKEEKVYKRIISTLNTLYPDYRNISGNYEKLLDELKSQTLKIINEKLDEINWDKVLIFGFTSKFYQWIPAMIIAEEIKKRNKDVKIIIGGFGNKNEAKEVLIKCEYFDFSTWGEGEYPLLRLAEKIQNNNTNYYSAQRLIFRDKGEIIISENTKSEYLDFNNYPLPSHDDYEKEFQKTNIEHKGRYPINSVRACIWNACKFCNYNQGYKYREREPEDIVKEIVYLKETYNVYAFYFVDNDVFCTYERFNKLLDLIIDVRSKTGYYFTFWAEMIPDVSLDEKIFKKIADAGFNAMFIGYDALTDTLLSKMRKRSTFAENIFFVKYAMKYKIRIDVNVLRDIYNETEEDVQESIRNLHYLRFYFNREPKFIHLYGTLNITTGTTYYKEIPDKEKELFNYSLIAYMLPEEYSTLDRFKLIRWKKNRITNYYEWERFEEVELYYQTQSFDYEIIESSRIYKERLNNKEIKTISLSELQYDILKKCNSKINNINSLASQLDEINIDKIKIEIDFLASEYILYRNTNYSKIISVIGA